MSVVNFFILYFLTKGLVCCRLLIIFLRSIFWLLKALSWLHFLIDAVFHILFDEMYDAMKGGRKLDALMSLCMLNFCYGHHYIVGLGMILMELILGLGV